MTLLRLFVQQQVQSPTNGSPAKASDAIARADVAHLKGNDLKAVKLLLRAL
ncbi:hypothetical protein GCM10025868_43990 [Angustibacter aerolatus]|uniref:Uncharacterized protein n=1 Tax=Angustibacter aerolatus TaxID=1162965 RepID=A0ABQ6JPT1_9ACTN|nr:hypothetical protein [Angustibacter aerolatus]GMA89149.1 hypothetical protein GCM10025868_43990 [Angustibacter aerolatus]